MSVTLADIIARMPMFNFEQLTGRMIDPNGYVIGIGYSGAALGKNNPQMQDVRDVGPIPVGDYTMGTPFDSPDHGPFCIPLIPDPGTQLYGRDAFLIHGDSVHKPGTASRGCIIMSRDVRNTMWQSGDHRLRVTSGSQIQQEIIT